MAVQYAKALLLEKPTQLQHCRQGGAPGYVQSVERHTVVSEVCRGYVPAILRHRDPHSEAAGVKKPCQFSDVNRATTARGRHELQYGDHERAPVPRTRRR